MVCYHYFIYLFILFNDFIVIIFFNVCRIYSLTKCLSCFAFENFKLLIIMFLL